MAAEDQPPRSAWYTSLDSNTLQDHKLGSVSPTDTKGILSLIEMGKLADVSFGDWLKRRRKGLGLTQQQLAAQINCSTVTLKKIEAEERRPSAQMVERLTEIFNIPPNEQTKFLRFARGDWQAIPSQEIEDAPWRVSYVAPRSNLPASTTSFIGREKEQDEIKNLIAKNRLVTLIGAGGIGKTRLSIQTAFTLLSDFPHGIWLIELAPLSDPALVAQAIVNTLGLIEQANRSPLTVLMDFLKDKQALLIIDNCEHLIQACAQLMDTLLHSCPDLHILATSREALDITGETLYRVPVLTTPDPVHSTLESLSQYEAVQLFLERAQSGLPDFSLAPSNALAIAQVCRHLDGIPLALELAAARVKGLSVEQIAARLDDRFRLLTSGNRTALPRHQTLQALIDWSHDLLTEPERMLFRRLSIFAGGWTLEAAEAVCVSDDLESNQILDLLLRLVDKSLVVAETQKDESRYHMLETIRQYAHEKLWREGEDELMHGRHLAYYVELAERAEPNLRAFGMIEWLDRLEIELDNIRGALEYALESDIEIQLRIASALLWFWHIRGYRNEGIDWLERGLAIEAADQGAHPQISSHTMIRGKALYTNGVLVNMRYDYKKAALLFEKSLTLFKELGPTGKRSAAYALLQLADSAQYIDNISIRNMLEQSLNIFHELNDKFGAAESLWRLSGLVRRGIDGLKQATKLAEEHVALRKEIGDQDGLASALGGLSNIAIWQGNYQDAAALRAESLAIFRSLKNKWAISSVLPTYGDVYFWQGDYEQATKIYQESLAVGQEFGERFTRTLYSLGVVAQLRGEYRRATQMLTDSLAEFRDQGHMWLIVGCLHTLGDIALAKGDDESAVEWYEEELTSGQEIQFMPGLIFGNIGLGKVAWITGKYAAASNKFEEVLRICHEASEKPATFHAFYGLGRVAQSQGNYAIAYANYAEMLKLQNQRIKIVFNSISLKSYICAVAYPLDALGTLATLQNKMERGARLLSAAEVQYLPLRFEMSAQERTEHDQAIDTARAALGEESFTATWEEGKKMTLEQAIAYALEESDG